MVQEEVEVALVGIDDPGRFAGEGQSTLHDQQEVAPQQLRFEPLTLAQDYGMIAVEFEWADSDAPPSIADDASFEILRQMDM